MDDHQCFLGSEGGIPPTKRPKLDETSGRPVGTKVGLGRTVGARGLSLGAHGGRMVLEGSVVMLVRVLPMANDFHMRV